MSSTTHSRIADRRLTRPYTQALMLTVALVTFACSGGGPSTITAPTDPSPSPSGSVAAITVTTSAQNPGMFQLAATARMTDNSTRDVTALARWESSDPSLATVSAGRVTVLASGEVDVRATYQNVSGSLRLVVMPGTQTRVSLSGIVREVPPTEHTLSGVRVEIVDGPDAGRFVMSDQSGNYRFTGLVSGRISIAARMDGYQPWHVDQMNLMSDAQYDAWLVLVPPKDASGGTATARCKDASWTWARDRAKA